MNSRFKARTAVSSLAALLLAIASLTAIPSAASAAGDVAVSVLDATTQKAIPGAFVSLIATAAADSNGDGLLDVDTGSAVVGGNTDSTGAYSPLKTDQSPLDDAKYGVVASANGYQSMISTLTVVAGSGSVSVKLTASTNNASSLSAFGGHFTAVAADGRSGVFYGITDSVPSLYRTTDYAGNWAPVNLNRDEPVEQVASDGIQGLSGFGLASNLITSGYAGEVAVTVGNTEWYSRDFGNNWHSFALPQANPLSVSWSHAHAADTADHVSLMVFAYATTTDLSYAFMPTANQGTAVGVNGKTEAAISIQTISGVASLKESNTDLVATAAGSSSVFIAVQRGLDGTKIYEVATGAGSITREGSNPTLIAGLARNTSNGNTNPATNDAFLFGGQSNVDGQPSSLVVYDRSVAGGKTTATVAVASLVADGDGNDVWTVGSSMWTDAQAGGFVAANGPIADSAAGSNAPGCGESSTNVGGFIAPMFAGVGNPDSWANGATTAMLESCVIVHVPTASTINGTQVPAGAVLVLDSPGTSNLTSAAFDAGFDFGQSDEVMVTAEQTHGLAKSATWLTGGADGSVMNVDNSYGYRPLLPVAGPNADSFIQNQASAGTDTTSGGFSAKGVNAPAVRAIAFDPTDPSAQLVSLDSGRGNRTLMSVDAGATYFTVGSGSTASTWWLDSAGQHWIASGVSTDPTSMLAVRQFSQDDLTNTQYDVTESGLDPDDPNYLGTRLNLSDAFADFGSGQFKVNGQQPATVQGLQGIAGTNLMLMAAGNDSSSSLALVALAGDPGAETLGSVKYFNSGGQLSGGLVAPSFSGQSVSSIQYCPTGSANSVSDKAFVALADQSGSSTGGIRMISNVASGSPSISAPLASGLALGTNDNVRDLKVDCDNGVIALVSRAASGAASPSSPLIFVSNNAGAAFKAVTKSPGQTLSATLSDLERIAVKSDSAAGTLDLVFTDIAGDVLSGQAKLTDFAKPGLSIAFRSVNDPLTQVATTLNGEAFGALVFSPSDTFVRNYISVAASQVTPTPTPQTAILGTGSGLFSLNLAGAKLIASKSADTITVTAKVGAASAASWTGAITLPQDKTAIVTANSTSGLPVTMSTSSPCTIANGVLSSNASSGTCVVNFTTVGNATYAAANENRTANLAAGTPKLDDTISPTYKAGADAVTTWSAAGLTLKNGTSVAVAATSASGLSVSVSLASGNCSLSAGVLTANAATGACVVSFSTAGSASYNAASISRTANLTSRPDSLSVSIAVGSPPAATGAASATWAAGQPAMAKYGQVAAISTSTTSKSSVQVSTSANCTYAAGVLTPNTGTGNCVVTFSTTSVNGWDAINETRTLNLSLATDSLVVSVADGGGQRVWQNGDVPLVFGGQATVSATSASGATVSIAVSGPCSLAAGTVSATSGVGNCSLTIGTQATSKYAAVTTTKNFALTKATDAITINKAPMGGQASVWVDGQVQNLEYGKALSLTASSISGASVNLTATGSCTLSGGRLTATSGTGTCSVAASTVGGLNYTSAITSRSVLLTLAGDALSATIAIGGASANVWATNQPSLRIDQTAIVAATSSSGKPVALTASGNCTLAGGVITPTARTGSCTITGVTSADGKYATASGSWTLTLAPKLPVADSLALTYRLLTVGSAIWTNAAPIPVNGFGVRFADQVMLASTSLSGTSPTLSATGSCKLSGQTLTITKGSGSCELSATLASSDGFIGLTQTRTLIAAPAIVPAPALTAMKVGAKQLLPLNVKVGTKTVAYAFSVAQAYSSICAVSNGYLVAKKKGTCSITVTTPSLTGYYGALKSSLVVKVG